jgi:hypothetical protein
MLEHIILFTNRSVRDGAPRRGLPIAMPTL